MTGKRRLGALFFDKFELLDIFGPLEMFGVLPDRYEIVTVAERKPSMASTQGPSVTIDRTFADCGQLDVLLVPGENRARGTPHGHSLSPSADPIPFPQTRTEPQLENLGTMPSWNFSSKNPNLTKHHGTDIRDG